MVTAKFKVGKVTMFNPTDPVKFAEALESGKTDQGFDPCAEIEMVPDYAQDKNSDWATATPSGVFRITVTNPSALKQMTQSGRSVHIEMSFED